MPRRNKSLHIRRQVPKSAPDDAKKTYRSQREAENAIKAVQAYRPEVQLDTYQSPNDGLWRLTSSSSQQPNK